MGETSYGKILLGGLFGAAIAALVTGTFNIQLEKQKFYFGLITKALDADDEDQRAQRLKFILALGVIKDDELSKKLETRANFPDTLPKLPQAPLAPQEQIPVVATDGWQVLIGDYKDAKEAEGKMADATKAGYPGGEIFGQPPHLHARFRFTTREEARNAANVLREARVSHSPDVLPYKSK